MSCTTSDVWSWKTTVVSFANASSLPWKPYMTGSRNSKSLEFSFFCFWLSDLYFYVWWVIRVFRNLVAPVAFDRANEPVSLYYWKHSPPESYFARLENLKAISQFGCWMKLTYFPEETYLAPDLFALGALILWEVTKGAVERPNVNTITAQSGTATTLAKGMIKF